MRHTVWTKHDKSQLWETPGSELLAFSIMNKVLWVSTWCRVEEVQPVMYSWSSSETDSPVANTCMWNQQSSSWMLKAITHSALPKQNKAKWHGAKKQAAWVQQVDEVRFLWWRHSDCLSHPGRVHQGRVRAGVQTGRGVGLLLGALNCSRPVLKTHTHTYRNPTMNIYPNIIKTYIRRPVIHHASQTSPTSGEALICHQQKYTDIYREAQKDTKFILDYGEWKIPVYFWLEKARVGINPCKQKQYVISHGHGYY